MHVSCMYHVILPLGGAHKQIFMFSLNLYGLAITSLRHP